MGEVREGEFLGGEECGGEGVEGLLFRWVGLGIALMGRGGGIYGVESGLVSWSWVSGALVRGRGKGKVGRGGERIREVSG